MSLQITSLAARISLRAGVKNKQRDLVLAALNERPMTDSEIQAVTGLDGNTERPRRGELVCQGIVRDSLRRRETPSHRSSIVWEIVP